MPLALLSALPGRLVNLLENDLLQALPLYVLMGAAARSPAGRRALYRTVSPCLPRGPAAPLVSGIGLGACSAP